MIKISINKEISRWYGIGEREISELLKAATPGEEIEISINSPGGEVYEGIAIFNLIREYAKSHNIIVKINGLAASMASYIAIAARTVNKDAKIIVYENSIFLIHNPWNIILGDYREFKKEAEYLEKLAAMSGSTYAYVSGKKEKEIRNLMDAETYFVGDEILNSGFANEFEKINQTDEPDQAFEKDRNTLIINAKLQVEKASEKLRATARADRDKAAALLNTVYNPSTHAEAPASGEKNVEPAPGLTGGSVHFDKSNPLQGEVMNKEELKKKYPELYAEIYGEGVEAGKKDERERVEAHLKLGEENNAMKVSAKFIREGNRLAEDKVQAEYLSAMKAAAALNARNGDNPPDVTPADDNGADDAAMEAAWGNGLSGKDEKGVKHG
jgi:ATP-dependent protease ClpP protease subunit